MNSAGSKPEAKGAASTGQESGESSGSIVTQNMVDTTHFSQTNFNFFFQHPGKYTINYAEAFPSSPPPYGVNHGTTSPSGRSVWTPTPPPSTCVSPDSGYTSESPTGMRAKINGLWGHRLGGRDLVNHSEAGTVAVTGAGNGPPMNQ